MNTYLLSSLKQHFQLWEIFAGNNEYPGESADYVTSSRNIMTPVVSEHLFQQGYQVSYPENRKFAICLTHDVDDIYPPLSHRVLSVLYSFKKWDWIGCKEHLFWNKKRRKDSPYINFRKIMELEKKYNAKSTFFFMTASRDPRRFRYHIEDIATELQDIVNHGWEVGLHGGYYSFDNFDAIKAEKKRLEEALGRKVFGYRNHYLRFRTPDTWEILQRCGFNYDTTYGYNKGIGFRNGMCHPFIPINNVDQRWIDIYELPLNIMDSAMYDLLKPHQAWELIMQLLEAVELNQGVLTVLWHNNTFSCPFREKWAELYEKILQYGKEKNAWMTSGEALLRWWKKNDY